MIFSLKINSVKNDFYKKFIKHKCLVCDKMNNYLYIRQHEAYDKYDACKVGITTNLYQRDTVYTTGEIIRGIFTDVFIILHNDLKAVEDLIKREFKMLNIKRDGGTEFYKKDIIPSLAPFFQEKKIVYQKLSKDEISKLVNQNSVIRESIVKNSLHIVPRDYQNDIINSAVRYYENNNKGVLALTCGVGKTLLSLWIMMKLGFGSLVIGVYNELLLNYWKTTVNNEFPEFEVLVVKNGVEVEKIQKFIQSSKKIVVITTYKSSCKVYYATINTNFTFDGQINDEAHHLSIQDLEKNKEDKKTFDFMLKLKSNKQLSLTATPTESNVNEEYFGKIIERRCLLWAINNEIVCDYVIQTVLAKGEQFDDIMCKLGFLNDVNKRLLLSAYLSIKSIIEGHSHHVLIYSNNKEHCIKLKEYIKVLSNELLPDLFCSEYHSEMSPVVQKKIINDYELSKYGIITCVYCLGEGWDFPLLDCVVFSENMTSVIRIVQSSLRACRKNKNEPNKIAKIILPVLDNDDWLSDENSDLKKVREVIYQIGLEDETITQKIKVYKVVSITTNNNLIKSKKSNEIGTYDEELTEKIKLKTVKRTDLPYYSYDKAKRIILDKNIKTKEEYFELCKQDNRFPSSPEIVYKNLFNNWIEYLNIERKYYNLEDCKNKVGEYLQKNINIRKIYLDLSQVSKELCKIDELFPPSELWTEYYNVRDLRDIITITNKKKQGGVLL